MFALLVNCLSNAIYLPYASNDGRCVTPCKLNKVFIGSDYYSCESSRYSLFEDKIQRCSPFKNLGVYGTKCRDDHPCDYHGYSYTWCFTQDSWEHCTIGEVNFQPKLLSEKGYYCLTDCQSYSGIFSSYSYCMYTENKWDYCTPNKVAIQGPSWEGLKFEGFAFFQLLFKT